MVEWPKATDCNSVFTVGSNPTPTSTLSTFIMKEKPKTIHFTDEPDNGIVHPDYIPEEEFAETGAVVVYCMLAIFIMGIAVTVYFLL